MTAKKSNFRFPGAPINPEVPDLSPGVNQSRRVMRNLAEQASLAVYEAQKHIERIRTGRSGYVSSVDKLKAQEKTVSKKNISIANLWDTKDSFEKVERQVTAKGREELLCSARERFSQWDWQTDEGSTRSPKVRGVLGNRSLFITRHNVFHWEVEIRVAKGDTDFWFTWTKSDSSNVMESIAKDLEAQGEFWNAV